MVKIYHPPSSDKESVRLLKDPKENIIHPHICHKRGARTVERQNNVSLVEAPQLFPDEAPPSKILCTFPPSLQRQKVIQKSRKWGLIPPSLIRQGRSDRESRRRMNDDERDGSASLTWLSNVRRSSKDQSEQRDQPPAGGTAPWFARLIRIPNREKDRRDTAYPVSLGKRATNDDGLYNKDAEETIVSGASEASSGFPNSYARDDGVKVQEVFFISLLHQFLDDPCSGFYNGKMFSSSLTSLVGPGRGTVGLESQNDLQKWQQRTSCFASPRLVTKRPQRKVMALPMSDGLHQQEVAQGDSDTSAPSIAPWFSTWISPTKSLDKGTITNATDPIKLYTQSSSPSPTHPLSKDSRNADNDVILVTEEKASPPATSDTANLWFSKWLKSGGQAKRNESHNKQETYPLRQQAASSTPSTTFSRSAGSQSTKPRLAREYDPVYYLENDAFSWVDRILLPLEMAFARQDDEELEDVDVDIDEDEDEDDVEPEDDDDIFSDEVLSLKPNAYIVTAKQQSRDEASVGSKKSIKRVRFDLGNDELKWR